jgi:hypothetical protein
MICRAIHSLRLSFAAAAAASAARQRAAGCEMFFRSAVIGKLALLPVVVVVISG